MPAARAFRASVSGAGTTDERVRYFIDGSECDYQHYVSQFVKDHSKMPEIPIGKGGRASDEEIAANAPKAAVDQTSHIDIATEALAPDAAREEAQEHAAGIEPEAVPDVTIDVVLPEPVAPQGAHMGAVEGDEALEEPKPEL